VTEKKGPERKQKKSSGRVRSQSEGRRTPLMLRPNTSGKSRTKKKVGEPRPLSENPISRCAGGQGKVEKKKRLKEETCCKKRGAVSEFETRASS